MKSNNIELPDLVANELMALIPVVFALTRRLNAKLHDELQLSRPHISLLFALKRLGPLGMTELARCQSIAKPNLTVLIDRLEELGMVERRHDAQDRRVIRLQLTSLGESHLEERLDTFRRQIGGSLTGRGPAEMQGLHESLLSVKRFMEQINPEE